MTERPGLLRRAHGGLLFLDEIGELGRDEQAMLLRAIEEKTFLPLGSDREVKSEFQLLAGTNRDLGADVGSGRFREDLLARIDLWTFRLPGLRERSRTSPPTWSSSWSRTRPRPGRLVRFNREASERYAAFAAVLRAAWTGNFRDLARGRSRGWRRWRAPEGWIPVETVEEESGD